MTTYTVTQVLNTIEGNAGLHCWRVSYASDDDSPPVVHLFPESTLAWRAAEYGLDPTDTAALLDIVLHEPFIPVPDPEPVRLVGQEPAKKAAPVHLYNAPTIADARTAHLARIADVQAGLTIDDPDQLLSVITARVIDPAKVEAMRGIVGRARQQEGLE